MDHEDEEDIADEVDGKNGMVALSTLIGARAVTLNTVRYAVIHPAVRVSYMHYSGIIQLMETPITPELQKTRKAALRVRSLASQRIYTTSMTVVWFYRVLPKAS